MAEYIEREAVHRCLDDLSSENLIGNENDTFISVANAHDRIENLPTADVVPKSEVERLSKELDELAVEHSDLIVEKDRLFDEVECLQSLNHRLEQAGLDMENKNQALIKQLNKIEGETALEVAREIFEEIDALFVRFYDDPSYSSGELGYDIAELKKKYTEGDMKC